MRKNTKQLRTRKRMRMRIRMMMMTTIIMSIKKWKKKVKKKIVLNTRGVKLIIVEPAKVKWSVGSKFEVQEAIVHLKLKIERKLYCTLMFFLLYCHLLLTQLSG
ncbi:hypothetical protein AAZV13_14G051150 [Glycine max]